MKLFRAAVLLLLAGLIGTVAFFGWPRYAEYADHATLESLAHHAREITSIEIIRLTDKGESGPAGSWHNPYDDEQRGIASRQTLTGTQAAELMRLWGELHFASDYMTGCHEPAYVLKFLTGRRRIFEASVCFHCENIYWRSTPFTTSARQMVPDTFGKFRMEHFRDFLTQIR